MNSNVGSTRTFELEALSKRVDQVAGILRNRRDRFRYKKHSPGTTRWVRFRAGGDDETTVAMNSRKSARIRMNFSAIKSLCPFGCYP